MSYLLTQMFLYLLCAFVLGLILGYLIWGRSGASSADLDALRAERDRLKKERDDLNTNLDACRARSAQERESIEALRAEKIDLQTKLDACETGRRAVDDIPAAAPVAAAVASVPAAEGTKPEGLSAPRGGQADDLKQINGVGPKMEGLLNSLGYYHFDQIAAWSPSEVAWVDNNLEGFKGRVTRDKWQDQAKDLAKA